MTMRRIVGSGVVVFVLMTAITIGVQPPTAAPPASVMPAYDDNGDLLLPADYRQWRLAGSSLGMSYGETAPGHEMFHHTLMEPTAYDHFARTGEFREGTMFALLLHGTGQSVLPQRHGQFAAEVHTVEMAVKDAGRVDEGWAYYNFGGMDGLRDRARPMPASACFACHAEHARRDNVFLQFYPLLDAAAPARPVAGPARGSAPAARAAVSAPSPDLPLALAGLDPVLLAEGREELGKPELEATDGRFRYQFVSEPTRARFAADRGRFAIQNETCPVVPGAPVDPARFAVHDGRIYAFATDDCVDRFRSRPTDYLPDE